MPRCAAARIFSCFHAALRRRSGADPLFFLFRHPLFSHAPLCLISQADAPGIKATVSEAKDPKACKYTEEGTLLHEMMQRVYKSDRRMAALADLEVTLSAADKAGIEATLKEKGAEKGFSAAEITEMMGKITIPDKQPLSQML